MDLETFIATAGRKTKAGQRLLNIPLSKAGFHDHQNGKQHADALKDAYQHHHGAAGRIGWQTTSSRPLIPFVKPAGAALFLLTMASRYTAWARFAILEAALLLGDVTGWDDQT
jgi:putative DNA primase/helicase